MCIITTTPTTWPYYDHELEELKRQLRLAQIEEEKSRIRREIDRIRRYPYCPTVPPTWIIPPAPLCPPAPTPLSINDVLRKIPAR